MATTGSILGDFSHVELSAADGKSYSMSMTPFARLALKLIGLPHLGFRMRAKIILAEAARLNNEARILDAGCGYGINSMLLAETGFRLDSIDLDPARTSALTKMLEEAPQLSKQMKIMTGSIASIPAEDNCYDGIVCSEVIEHIVEDETAVKEMARVLRPNGTLILTVPFDSRINRRIFKTFGHERPGYTNESLSKIFSMNGLTILKTVYYERPIGGLLFRTMNAFKSKALLGILFYPFYALYLIDYHLGYGEPNQMAVVAIKK